MTAWNVFVIIAALFMGFMFARNAYKMYNFVKGIESNKFDFIVMLTMWSIGVIAVIYFIFAYLVSIFDWNIALPMEF